MVRAYKIERGRNFTYNPKKNYSGKREPKKTISSVYTEFVDSANLVQRETNTRVTQKHQHISPDNLPDIAPAKQIRDSLTAEEFDALGKFVYAGMLSYSKYKTTNFEEAQAASRSSTERIPLNRQEFNILRVYWMQRKALIKKHRDFLELFSHLIEKDVGQVRERRKQALQTFYELGKIITIRDTKSVQIAGLAGYLKAIAEILVAKQREIR